MLINHNLTTLNAEQLTELLFLSGHSGFDHEEFTEAEFKEVVLRPLGFEARYRLYHIEDGERTYCTVTVYLGPAGKIVCHF